MEQDFTQRQTAGEQMRAEELSRRTTVPPADLPGYRLEKLLGQGAFGQVWVGKDLNTGRQIAVKFYLHSNAVDWSQLAREVKNLVSMSTNRYVVQVLEVGWEAEPPFYVMEYLENGSLEELIRSSGALPVAQAEQLFLGIGKGLNVSHGRGVLHCDLKPANVLLDQDMQPKLADFGQSRLSHEQTPSLGTLFYMAPEQADLNAIPDARWDVYALGAIYYTMLVGSPPYRTPEMVETLDTAASLPDRLQRYRNSILKMPPPRTHAKVRGVDRLLVQIINRCLAKNPENRFENVQQVLEALHERQLVRARRPLMLLGIVGPIMLLLVMAFFSWRGISVATTQSKQELRQWALRSNEFAAKFAARTMETEISGLFRLLIEETRLAEFRENAKSCIDTTGTSLLDELAYENFSDARRERFLKIPAQNAFQTYLQNRFDGLLVDSVSARFDSLFFIDHRGTILASTFAGETENTSAGRNFAYRSYFTGLRDDLPKTVRVRDISPANRPIVSAPFSSTVTQRWKVAVCVPVFQSDIGVPNSSSDGGRAGQVPEQDSGEVAGLLVLTINLGDFELLSQSRQVQNPKRFAVLVDGHVGEREGTLLQHPVLKKLLEKSKGEVQTSFKNFQISSEQMAKLKAGGAFDYQDPAQTSAFGNAYDGVWIAAMQRVSILREPAAGPMEQSTSEQETDLWVLVQERAETVTDPVNSLFGKLVQEGLIALVALICVITLMWFLVMRALQLPERGRTILSQWLGYESTVTSENAK